LSSSLVDTAATGALVQLLYLVKYASLWHIAA